MRNFLLGFLFIFLAGTISAQAYSGPESVEYDSLYGRWLVGNKNNGTVLSLSPGSGTLSPFCSGVTNGPYGIEILDSVLYCCSGGRIRGFNLASGAQVFNVDLAASFLNGICSDGGSNLFITDFTAKKIYRLNVVTSVFNVMVTGLAKSPNGIIYDGANNRCVFVNWGASAPIMAMSLADSTTSIIKPTTLSNIDGISRDLSGRWYVAAWGNNALNRFASDFTGTSTPVMTGLSSPADLDINAAGDSIGIPNSGTANNVVFYHICTVTTLLSDFTSFANGATVQFTDATTGGTPTSWSWNFGDAGTSTLQNPAHTYTNSGTYEVCLIVSDACGSDTTCDSVSVTATSLQDRFQHEFSITQDFNSNEIRILSNRISLCRFKVFDIKGSLQIGETLQPMAEKLISMDGLSPGIYVFSIDDEKNGLLHSGKISIR